MRVSNWRGERYDEREGEEKKTSTNLLQITYCRSVPSLKSMPMRRLLFCKEEVDPDSGAADRVGAKAEAKGADRTTAAEATVTNESLMFFRGDFMCGKNK